MVLRLLKSLTKRNYNLPDFYTTDLHSHLIPGIDDGVKTLDESIDLIKQLKSLGLKKLIVTPHIMEHRFPNTIKTIRDGYELVKAEVLKQKIDIDLQIGAEYYYDENFINQIRKKELLTFSDNYVLFEFSYIHKPFGLEQIVFELLNAGYKPILAHPERYKYFSSNPQNYKSLKDLGLFFQVNINSFNNYYGKKAQKAANYLHDNGLIDFLGSDTHNQKQFNSLKSFVKTSKFQEINIKNKIKNSFI